MSTIACPWILHVDWRARRRLGGSHSGIDEAMAVEGLQRTIDLYRRMGLFGWTKLGRCRWMDEAGAMQVDGRGRSDAADGVMSLQAWMRAALFIPLQLAEYRMERSLQWT